MVFGRRRSKQNINQSASMDVVVNDAAVVSTRTEPVKSMHGLTTKTSMQGSSIAVVNAEVQVDVRADILFGLLADPNQHTTIFDAIEGASFRLVAEDGPWRKYELDYKARWKFWRVSGVCDNKVYLETHADNGTVSFKLREPGFLKVYEGTWLVRPLGHKSLHLYKRQRNALATHVANGDTAYALGRAHTPPSSMGSFGLAPPCATPRPAWSGLFQAMADAISTTKTAFPDPFTNVSGMGVLLPKLSPAISQSLSAPSSSAASDMSGCCALDELQTPYPERAVLQIVDLRMSPKIAPPYPLGGLLKGHAQGQVENMISGLVACASRLQALGVTPLHRQTPTLHKIVTSHSPHDSNGDNITNSRNVDETSPVGASSESLSSLSPRSMNRSSGSCWGSLSTLSTSDTCGAGDTRWDEAGLSPSSVSGGLRHTRVSSHRIAVSESLDDD